MAAIFISATASTHFAVNAVVSWPCTVNASMTGGAPVSCAPVPTSAVSPVISYANDPQSDEMVMTVVF